MSALCPQSVRNSHALLPTLPVENSPDNRAKSATVRAASVDVAAECEEATPYPLQIRCVGFEAALFDHGVIGFATLEIGGVMVLPDVRVVHAAHGVAVIFPRRGVLQGDALARHPNGAVKMVKTVMFCRHEDWIAFSNAAVAAVRRAYPGTISNADWQATLNGTPSGVRS